MAPPVERMRAMMFGRQGNCATNRAFVFATGVWMNADGPQGEWHVDHAPLVPVVRWVRSRFALFIRPAEAALVANPVSFCRGGRLCSRAAGPIAESKRGKNAA